MVLLMTLGRSISTGHTPCRVDPGQTIRLASGGRLAPTHGFDLHRYDFVRWRNLDKNVEVQVSDFQELQLAVSAILEHLGSV